MPNGLMSYNPGSTATPPFVPQARPAGLGGGLFGGGVPYPVDPRMQQGLMQDAWRQFGLQLLANAQNVNLGQGLAAALAAGRQAYAGGAERAYQVGRERERDISDREYREDQAEAYRARTEVEKSAAQTERDTAEAEKQGVQALEQRIMDNPFLSPAQKEANILRLRTGGSLTDATTLPQEEPAMTPYQREQVRLAEERLGLQRQRASRPAAQAEPAAGPVPAAGDPASATLDELIGARPELQRGVEEGRRRGMSDTEIMAELQAHLGG